MRKIWLFLVWAFMVYAAALTGFAFMWFIAGMYFFVVVGSFTNTGHLTLAQLFSKRWKLVAEPVERRKT